MKQGLWICFLSLSLSLGIACKPKNKADVLVFGRPSDSVGLDLARQDDGESITIGINILETLVRFKLGGTEIEPALAEKWTVSPDGKSYTFYLRPNVKFHDGTALNADAVVFSVERQFAKNHPAHAFGAPYKYWDAMSMDELIQGVKKINDLTVQFILKKPNAPFLANMAMPFMSIVSPAAVMRLKEQFDQKPVGTGPYILKSWKKDDSMELQAFDSYWGDPAKMKKVVVRVIPDNQVRLLELKRGGIDIMDFPNPSDVKAAERETSLKVLQQEGLNIGYLAFNMKRKPLDKEEVREAMSLAIDRDRLLRELYQGSASLASNPIPPMVLGYNKSIAQTPYDPQKAKALLEKAGVHNLSLDLWAMPVARAYNPNARKMAEFIQADLRKIGIETRIISYDWGTFLDKTGKGEHELLLFGWSGDNGDPDNFLYMLLSKDAALKNPTQNFAFWMNNEFNRLVKLGQSEIDSQKRALIYSNAISIFAKERPWLPIAHALVSVPMRSEIEGYVIDPIAGNRWFASVSRRLNP